MSFSNSSAWPELAALLICPGMPSSWGWRVWAGRGALAPLRENQQLPVKFKSPAWWVQFIIHRELQVQLA